MNILYVCGHDPHDQSFGGAQRTHLLWKALQEVGEVYTVCYYHHEGKISERIVAIDIKNPTGKRSWVNRGIRRIWDLFDREGKKILPVPATFSIETPFPDIHFDAVVCRYCEPASLFHLWKIAPLYIDVDDHPIQAFETRDSLLLKKWQRPIAALLQKLEFHLIERHTTGGWIANPDQVSQLRFKKKAIALKNVSSTPSKKYISNVNRRNYLFSVGFMQYQPNYLGIHRFLTEVWPVVYEKHPELKYYIVGKNAPSDYVKQWEDMNGVEYLGFVDNLEELYQYSLATVVAVDQGSGTCIKTLESMSFSRICLARPFGIRGLESEAYNGKNGLHVYHNSAEFLSLLDKVVLEESERNLQEQRAKQFIEKNYSFELFKASVKQAFL